MKRALFYAAVLAALSSAPVLAQQAASQPMGVARTVQAKATVQSVDQAKRSVTLKLDDGREVTTNVDPKVTNLNQVKPGDVVTVSYTEAIAVSLGGTGPGVKSDAMAAKAKEGTKPGGAVAQYVTVSARVEALDAAKGSVTFKGPEGKTKTVMVQDPNNREMLKKLKVGDVVNITYAEAVTMMVTPAKK